MARQRVIIMGAAGRDFHNFNFYFRGNPDYEVVGFTATQIPGIHDRRYPAALAGDLYPDGIPIYDESELLSLIRHTHANQVVFAYSDIPHDYVMHRASQVLAAGADFRLVGLNNTQLQSIRPVIAISAVRTGCGKSQTARAIVRLLNTLGRRVVAIRHPMPYGDLLAQMVQRFETYEDLDEYHTTIEEREEYEPYLDNDAIVYAGVDYEKILHEAELEACVIVWDGGNNDMPFIKPDLHIVVADPHRAGHESSYFPGEVNARMADVLIINKVDTANYADVLKVRESLRQLNPNALILEAASPITIDEPSLIRGKRVLVVEDGPTTTHGEMSYGAGLIAAQRYGAAEVINPRPFAVGSIAETFAKYPKIGPILPAMGYGEAQRHDLEMTINRANADAVISATPIDLRRILQVKSPVARVRYELQLIGEPTLEEMLRQHLPDLFALPAY